MKLLHIKIGPLGEITVEATGFEDAKCLDALHDLEEITGKMDYTQLKPEGRRVANKTRQGVKS